MPLLTYFVLRPNFELQALKEMGISGNTILCSECVNICLYSPYMKPGRYTLPTGTQHHFCLGHKFFLNHKSVIQKKISIEGFLIFTLFYSLVFNTSLDLDWLTRQGWSPSPGDSLSSWSLLLLGRLLTSSLCFFLLTQFPLRVLN